MEPLRWEGDHHGRLHLLDQTLLPGRREVLPLDTLEDVADAIRRLAVRGAPAIGIAAAYGVVLGARAAAPAPGTEVIAAVDRAAEMLVSTRPTAVNLAWAAERMRARARREPNLEAVLDEALAIHEEERVCCRRIGEAGAGLVPEGGTVLTHCNTGALATGGMGTAQAVLTAAWEQGRRFRVLADETRPLLQGARLTALELVEAGIPVDVVADGAAAGLIARGEVDLVVTGADRIAANGDVANKVGTYGLALACRAHGVPFWVAAPASTFDAALATGASIPIEDRDPDEILAIGGHRHAAPGAGARNPAFDVTPADLLAGLVTDRGRIRPVTADRIKEVLAAGR